MDRSSSGSPGIASKLGLINGVYSIDCRDLEDWEWTSEDFSLILYVEGDAVWDAYDFGMFSGIMHLDQRPYKPGHERLSFTWRGRDNSEGETSFSPHNNGWIEFHGDGRIEGMISCYGKAEFLGRRTSGSQTNDFGRSLSSIKAEWDGYNQQNYDYANRARWR